MRRQLTAYLSEEEFQRLRDEADQRGITLSRFVKERLFASDGKTNHCFSDAALAALEKRIINGNRSVAAEGLKPIAQQLATALAMIDQFVLSALIHLPEIPEEERKRALASGERRHAGWRAEVEEILHRVGESIPATLTSSHRNGATT